VRYLPFIIELGLLVYALIDCVQTPDADVRYLPRWAWILLIVLFAYVGPIAWLVAGRQRGAVSRQAPWPSTQTAGFPEYERPPRGPDDDPEFLATIRESDSRHEQMLREWESQLREREERLRRGEEPDEEPTDR
jgi:hypothetical protein